MVEAARWPRLPGVLPTAFAAPVRPRLIGAAQYPAAYSRIIGTPITMGENDIHGDCVAVASWNATAVAWGRRGILAPIPETAPFELYETLGGMPADVGLDPGALFAYWQKTAINGWGLQNIEALALDDVAGIEQAIIDTGFVYFTATLTQAQLTQSDWVPVASPVDGGHATILSWWEAGWFYDETWGEEVRVSPDFIARQGLNLWRIELVAA